MTTTEDKPEPPWLHCSECDEPTLPAQAFNDTPTEEGPQGWVWIDGTTASCPHCLTPHIVHADGDEAYLQARETPSP